MPVHADPCSVNELLWKMGFGINLIKIRGLLSMERLYVCFIWR